MEAIKESTRAGKVATQLVDGRCTALVCSPCFRVEKLILREGDRMANRTGSSGASAQVLVGLEGCAVVESPAAAEVTVVRGEAVVVPAEIPEFSVRGLWNSELLRATVPGGNIQEPETKL
jgi:mannose-6-phosphate isomerase class I